MNAGAPTTKEKTADLSTTLLLRQQEAGDQDVVADGDAGSFCVAGADRSVDFAVVFQGVLDRHALGELAHAGKYGAVNSLEEELTNTIATGVEDGVVESH